MTDKNLTYQERRKEIKKLITELGLWNISKTQLAKKYDVSRDTIYRDIRNIIKGVPKQELEEIAFELSSSYKKIIKDLRKKMQKATDTDEKIKLAYALDKIKRGFTDILESYGLKEKIADKIEQDGEITVRWKTEKEMKDGDNS